MLNYNNKVKSIIIFALCLCLYIVNFSYASAYYTNTVFTSYVDINEENPILTPYNLDYKPQNVSVERNKVTGNTIDTIHFENSELVKNNDYLEVYTVIKFCYKDLTGMEDVNLTPEIIEGLPWSYINMPITKVIDVNDEILAKNRTSIDINFDDVMQAFYDSFSVTVDRDSGWRNVFDQGLKAAVTMWESIENPMNLPRNLYQVYNQVVSIPEEFNEVQKSISYMNNCINLGTENNLFTYQSNIYYLRYAKTDSTSTFFDDLKLGTFNVSLYKLMYDAQGTTNTTGINFFLVKYNFDITTSKLCYFAIDNDRLKYLTYSAGTGDFQNYDTKDSSNRVVLFSSFNLKLYDFSNNRPLSSGDIQLSNLSIESIRNVTNISPDETLFPNNGFNTNKFLGDGGNRYGAAQIIDYDITNSSFSYGNNSRGFSLNNISYNGKLDYYSYDSVTSTWISSSKTIDNHHLTEISQGLLTLPIMIYDYSTSGLVQASLDSERGSKWFMSLMTDSDKPFNFINYSNIPIFYGSNDGLFPQYYSGGYDAFLNFKSGNSPITGNGYYFSQFVSVLKQYDINNYQATNDPYNNYVSDPSGVSSGAYVTNNNISQEINKQNNKIDTFQVDENSNDCIDWLKAIYYKTRSIDSRLQNTLTLINSWNIPLYLQKFDNYFLDIIVAIKSLTGTDYQKIFNENVNDFNQNYITTQSTSFSNVLSNYSDRFPVCLIYLPQNILSVFNGTREAPDFNFAINIPIGNENVTCAFGSDTRIVNDSSTLDECFGIENSEDNWFDDFVSLLRLSQIILFSFCLLRVTYVYFKNMDN